ncbi:hypothetical protein MAPG_11814 [Magnaporthiopsis poae ATCC 64411]|uniref:Mediator of RNA polymerase II transcription subunit 6 n=1 Tax=Magnaporthiopsis poae (strain ATCC 64411 / 73-15) TaxID=644358 RepID=A0A0C4EG88_MAGP6|nr:hypothetical protein MAPG_11814 [Magnaporthiopsis poae ATCC 64411]
MDNKTEPLLDEIQWSSPQSVVNFQGIHSNSVLYYFAESPFFDRTSNNAVVFNQAVRNQSMLHIVATREAFEGRLREMAGLEYMVAQEPAETGPGAGTGVWVIRKQTRKKVKAADGTPLPDELEVHADYFVMGENIYMAPSLSDVLSSRIRSVPTRAWPRSPSPSTRATAASTWTKNPITGKPGEFHLSSTGRKDMKLTVPVIGGPSGAGVALPVLKTLPDNSPLGKDAKPEKAGRAGAPPKPKRRKSKGGGTTPS